MSSERPGFILCFAGDQQGCGFHRINVPLATLVDCGAVDGRIDMAVWPVEAAVACAPDTVIWQRQTEDGQIEAMRKYREALPNALFVYELDDYLDEIPDKSYHASFMPPNLTAKVAEAIAI